VKPAATSESQRVEKRCLNLVHKQLSQLKLSCQGWRQRLWLIHLPCTAIFIMLLSYLPQASLPCPQVRGTGSSHSSSISDPGFPTPGTKCAQTQSHVKKVQISFQVSVTDTRVNFLQLSSPTVNTPLSGKKRGAHSAGCTSSLGPLVYEL